MKALTAILIAMLIPATAHAADKEDRQNPREKVLTLVVYGDDPCPAGNNEEIVICGREPESERYRIPKALRGKSKREEAAGRSWSDRVQVLEMVGRDGRPNSCSPVGSNGQTGCFEQFLAQAHAEREAEKAERSQIP